jgi:uncharacterized membrane protein
MNHPDHRFLPGASKRLEALSDGVFAIACTLLVLEIKIPHFEKGLTISQQWESFSKVIPSIIIFCFSFLNILVFWVNHDSINKAVKRYDTKTTYLNLIFLLLISLIPFTTAFLGENLDSFVANACYGLVLCMASVLAVVMYHHLAFRSGLFFPEVTQTSRKKIYKRIAPSPFLYIVAIAGGYFTHIIPLVIYAALPIIFMFLPQLDFDTKSEASSKNQPG